jgi:adenylate kinase
MASTAPGPALTILGRQGSGKGTQAQRVAHHFGLMHLSTGDLLRNAVAKGTELGERVARDLNAGRLVADEVMFAVVEDCLSDPDFRRWGFILDGYPRTPEQAIDLMRLLEPKGLDAAILLDLPLDVAHRRLEARRVCSACGTSTVALNGEEVVPCPACGEKAVRRPDDTPAAIERRLATYEAEAQPLLDLLQDTGILLRVDALGTPDEVFGRLKVALQRVVWGTGRAVS